MNQADVSKLVSRLRINIAPSYRRTKNPDGARGRLNRLKKVVTGLVKHERLELNYNRADEARGYVERLISEAIRHGDTHAPTMEMADFWLEEKQLVHKLFKVLAPRYQNYQTSYTRMFKLSSRYPDAINKYSVLELKGNPYPSLVENVKTNRNLLHNILLEAARKDYRMDKYKQLSQSSPESIESSSQTTLAQESVEQDSSVNHSMQAGSLPDTPSQNISQAEPTEDSSKIAAPTPTDSLKNAVILEAPSDSTKKGVPAENPVKTSPNDSVKGEVGDSSQKKT